MRLGKAFQLVPLRLQQHNCYRTANKPRIPGPRQGAQALTTFYPRGLRLSRLVHEELPERMGVMPCPSVTEHAEATLAQNRNLHTHAQHTHAATLAAFAAAAKRWAYNTGCFSSFSS